VMQATMRLHGNEAEDIFGCCTKDRSRSRLERT